VIRSLGRRIGEADVGKAFWGVALAALMVWDLAMLAGVVPMRVDLLLTAIQLVVLGMMVQVVLTNGVLEDFA